ncbi:motility associated factor glycosyltransferase family protein [Shewanella sp. MF05960]|uniref:motility associated factor glycosyltransferase family protein n=1 Tax=Shewanella sp. MF05960 TaxID=3434874 RepID=UPI003D7C1302
MSDLFTKNMDIIESRWPLLAPLIKNQSIEHFDAQLITGNTQTISVDGIQLSSRHDRVNEAKRLINSLPKNTQTVSIYGIGMGDLPSFLIDNESILQIKVYLFSLSLFNLLICYTDQTEWLTNRKVELLEPININTLDKVYLSSTPDLILVNDKYARIRDLIIYDKNIDYVNGNHEKQRREINTRFIENLNYLKLDSDISELKKKYHNQEALIIATGPTLEKHYDYLLSLQSLNETKKPLLIAVDTALKALNSRNIIPDIVITLDYHITEAYFPKNISPSINLVYFPTSSLDVIKKWSGSRFNAFQQGRTYSDKTLSKTELFSSGSIVHPAIDLAVYLNIKNITLLGCDFCYPGNKTHAFWDDGALGVTLKFHKHHWVLNGRGERVATELNFRAYLRSLEVYIASKPEVNFYQSSLESAYIEGTTFKELTL